MNFNKIRDKMCSKEGKEKLAHLNELNMDIQQLEWNLNLKRMHYAYQSLLYKEWLGYELSEQDNQEKKNLLENLKKLDV